MSTKIDLAHVRVILHRPRYPENIGAAARAACNMGIRRLDIVQPENPAEDRIRMLATHAAREVVDGMTTFDSLADALRDCQYVVGTTARLGGERQVVLQPGVMAHRLIPISQENEIAVVFGPEDRGLTNEDLRLCHALINIPTAAFSSLNLAQAVMVVCYALFTADEKAPGASVPRLANRQELDSMYAQVKDILVRISYVNPENPDYWLNHIRHFFTRIQLRAREVSIIRGLCRQIDWYARKNYEDGLAEGRRQATKE
jgi:tRNA/rRNA methyltransferase